MKRKTLRLIVWIALVSLIFVPMALGHEVADIGAAEQKVCTTTQTACTAHHMVRTTELTGQESHVKGVEVDTGQLATVFQTVLRQKKSLVIVAEKTQVGTLLATLIADEFHTAELANEEAKTHLNAVIVLMSATELTDLLGLKNKAPTHLTATEMNDDERLATTAHPPLPWRKSTRPN